MNPDEEKALAEECILEAFAKWPTYLLRGEIRWADLNPVRGSEQGGLRPVLILSQYTLNERSGSDN